MDGALQTHLQSSLTPKGTIQAKDNVISDTQRQNIRVPRIIGGKRTTIAEHPYQVLMYLHRKFECSGSIVAAYWVLTAAHCTSEVDYPKSIIIRAGSSNRYRGGFLYRAVKIVTHPDYDKQRFNYDFSLIRVKRPFNFRKHYIKAIRLTSIEPAPRTHLIVSGWGTTGWKDQQKNKDQSPFYSTYLMEIDIFTIERKLCERNYAFVNPITESMICASGPNRDACAKDSGGPLVDPVRKVQVGIVSWGAGCAYPLYPGVYSNIAHAKPWIESIIGIQKY